MPTQLVTTDEERAFLLEVCKVLQIDPRQVSDRNFRIVYRTHYPVSDVVWSEWLVDPSDYRQASNAPSDLPPTRPHEEPIESSLLTEMLEERGLDPDDLIHVDRTSILP